jgi:hypothetical protein
VVWWHYLDWQLSCQCPLCHPEGKSWQLSLYILATGSPLSSFIFSIAFTFYRFIYTFLNHMLLFWGAARSLGEDCWQCWQTWEGSARESAELPASLRFPHIWLSQSCSWESVRNCFRVFEVFWTPPQKAQEFVSWNKKSRKRPGIIFSPKSWEEASKCI